MKKLSIIFLLFFYSFYAHAQTCYYAGGWNTPSYYPGGITVTHYPAYYCPPSNYSPSGSYHNSSAWYQGLNPSVQAAKEAAKKECISKAEAAQKQCEESYSNLNSICDAYIGLVGGVALVKFLKYLNVEAPALSGAIGLGATAANANPSTTILGCDALVPSAMQYCKAGSQKMKNDCG